MGLFDKQENYDKSKAAMQRANQVKSVADSLAGQDLNKDTPRIQDKLKELEKLTGSKAKAKKAVEDSNLAAGAREGIVRRFMRGW